MRIITIFFVAVFNAALAQAEAVDAIRTSSIVFATFATSFAPAHAQYVDMKPGFCTGGRTSCFVLGSNNVCPVQYCNTDFDSGECQANRNVVAGNAEYGEEIPCSALTKEECNAAANEFVIDCKYVNQGAINSVLIALASLAVLILLVILYIVFSRLPAPKKEAAASPQTDEES